MVAVDVAASPQQAFSAVMDFRARVADVAALKEATVYLDEPTRKGVRWVMGMAGLSITFHTLYEVDPQGLWCTYALDPSKDNALRSSGGGYRVEAIPGGSRIVYTAAVTADGDDGWIRRQMQEKGSRSLLLGMKARAEAASRGGG